MKILHFFANHLIEIIGLVIAYFGLIVPIYQYLNSKHDDEKEKRFKNFHQLIKDLVQPEAILGVPYLDRQIAIVYELKNLKEYYPVISRILIGLKTQWHNPPTALGNPRLIGEIDLTLKYIDNYQKRWYRRFTNYLNDSFL